MQQFYANGRAMPSKTDWKEERSLIAPLAIGGTFPADTRQIWVLFLAFCKPFFRKWVHKLKIWGHLLRTRVPLLEKRDPILKKGVPLLSFSNPLSAKCISFFRRCDYIFAKCVPFFAKCVPLLGKRDSILGESDRTFITSERYLATCVPLSEKRDPVFDERDHTFIRSEQYFATCDSLLVKRDPYFATCVPMSAKRTTVWQKSDIQISKRVHGESICVPRKRKTIPKKALFCVISSRKSLQASDLITTQAQPKNDLRITQETAKDDLSLTQPRPSLRTGYTQGSPKDDTTNSQGTDNNDTRNVRLVYRECTVSVRGVYRKGTGEVLKRYWRATKDSLNVCTSCVDQLYGKSRRVVAAMTNTSMPFVLALMCFMLFNLSDAWAQSAESRTAEGQTENLETEIADILTPKVEYTLEHNINKPLGSEGNGMGQVRPIMQTMLTGYQEGIKGRRILASQAFATSETGLDDMQAYRIGCYNCTLLSLFQMASFDGKRMMPRNRTLLEVKDPMKLQNTKDRGTAYQDWLRSGNGFTYEAVSPFALGRKNIYKKMTQDMSEYFPQYSVSIEKRPVECLLLVVEGNTDALMNKGGNPKVSYSPLHFSMSNSYDVDYLVERLHYYLQNEPPLINKVAIRGKIDIDIKASLSNVSELNEALKAYGLRIEKGIEVVDMLVISDSGQQPVHLPLEAGNYGQIRGFDWGKLVGGIER
ncbi:hypothetical protein [Sphingobacterium corticibacterium]|nr:hypothetical protein [Sphingobacterium corticibacterium]